MSPIGTKHIDFAGALKGAGDFSTAIAKLKETGDPNELDDVVAAIAKGFDTDANAIDAINSAFGEDYKQEAATKDNIQWPDNREGKYGKTLEEEVAKGEIPVRGALAQKMTRIMTDAEKADYNRLPMKEKSRFRLNWAQAQLTVMQTKYSRSEEWSIESAEIGEYVPLTVLIEREGGAAYKENVEAALRHATKCVKMGGKWLSFNPLTERVEFLHVRKQYNELFRQKWTAFVSLHSNDPAGQVKTSGDSNYEKGCAKVGKEKKNEGTGEKVTPNKRKGTEASDGSDKKAQSAPITPHRRSFDLARPH